MLLSRAKLQSAERLPGGGGARGEGGGGAEGGLCAGQEGACVAGSVCVWMEVQV